MTPNDKASRDMSMTATTDTFPVQCTSCAEIVDVAADTDGSATYNCAMCGAEVPWREAEDFELPCPAEVVIEEQSANDLRFRVPRFLSGSDPYVTGWICIVAGAGIFCVPLVKLAGYPMPLSLNEILAVLMIGGLLIALGAVNGRGVRLFELSRRTVKTSDLFLRRLRLQEERRDLSHKSVFMHTKPSTFWPFQRPIYVSAIKGSWWDIECAESSNPHVARYVTHIIRRHLQAQGHDLHHGRR